MAFLPLGDVGDFLRLSDSVSFDRIRGGVITAQELVIAGGTEGVIRSQNFNPVGPVGWAIFGDGSASFGASVSIGGDVFSGNWDGTRPADLSSVDAGASLGYYLDSSVGSMQLEGDFWVQGDITLGGELTGGTITGPLFRTAAAGDRIEIDGPSGDGFISLYDSSQGLAAYMGWAATGYGANDLTLATLGNLNNIHISAAGAIELKAVGSGADAVVVRATGVGVPATLFSVQELDGSPEHFRVDDNGNLHMSGDRIYMDTIGGNDYIHLDEADNYFRIVIDGGEKMRVDSSGNMGISGTIMRFEGVTNDTYFQGNEGSYFRWVYQNDEIMRLANASNQVRLDLYDSSYGMFRKIEGTELYIDNEQGNRDTYLRTDNGSGIKNRIFIDGSNNMVFYNHDGGSKMWLGNNHMGNTTTSLSTGNTTDRWVFNWAAQFQIHKTSQVSVYIGRDGTTGGAISFRWGTAQCGYVSLASNSTTYGTSSDVTLKGNLRDLDTGDALRRVLGMRLREWEWKESGEYGLGFVAQEIHPFAPNAVDIPDSEDEGNPEGLWGLDYGRLTPWLVGAAQEQNERIDRLEQRLDRYEQAA